MNLTLYPYIPIGNYAEINPTINTYRLDRKIKSKERQLEALKTVTSCVSPTYGGEGGHGNRVGSPVEYAALRIVFLSNEIEEDRKNLVTMLEEIGSVINRLGNSDYVELMTMRYIMFLRWDDIICRMGYAQNTVFRKHREALERIRLRCG